MTPFIVGCVCGFFWYPIWKIIKKIHSNAMKAHEEANRDR